MSSEPIRTGEIIGPYRLVKLIAKGGMGNIYEAMEPALDRRVAIKMINRSLSENPGFVKRFQREAKVLARVNHPNVVTILSIQCTAGLTYLAMEFVEGMDLRQYILAGQFLPGDLRTALRGTADGLAAIHACQVVHRDIKLSNVLITPQKIVKIGDFGLAKILGDKDHEVTETGQLIGTIQYMAPELFDGAEYTAHSDIFSLGLLFYMLLAGPNPFLGKSDMDTAKRIHQLEIDFPPELRAYLSGELRSLILGMLAKDPYKRPGDMQEVRKRLASALAQSPSFAMETHWPAIQALENGPELTALLGKLGCKTPLERALVLERLAQTCGADSSRWPQDAVARMLVSLRAAASAGAPGPPPPDTSDTAPSIEMPAEPKAAAGPAAAPAIPARDDTVELDAAAVESELRKERAAVRPTLRIPQGPIELDHPPPLDPDVVETRNSTGKFAEPFLPPAVESPARPKFAASLRPRPRTLALLALLALGAVGYKSLNVTEVLRGEMPDCKEIVGSVPAGVSYHDVPESAFFSAAKSEGLRCYRLGVCWVPSRPWINLVLEPSRALPKTAELESYEGGDVLLQKTSNGEELQMREISRAKNGNLVLGLESCRMRASVGTENIILPRLAMAASGVAGSIFDSADSPTPAASGATAPESTSWNLRLVEQARSLVRSGKSDSN